MNESSEQLNQMFLERMKSMKKEQLTNMLRCNICQGLFRFAHTIVDCGHTFCQVCIFNYIRGFKGRNPVIKCPQCHSIVDNNYRRSIIRDVYKQNLVDILAPQFARQDQIIVNRVQQLFPELDLQYLFQQFKFSLLQNSTKQTKKQSDSNSYTRLPDKIKQKFNISFQNFYNQIIDQQKFNNLLSIAKNSPQDPKIIQIKPKTARDFEYIGINNQMKTATLDVTKLQRFIQKKALQRIDKTQKVPDEWLGTSNEKLGIKIYLEINQTQIDPNDDLDKLLKLHKGHPILYRLKK